MAALPKRIIKETERLVSDPVPGIIATPSEDNLRYFEVTIIGPNQSPYAKGKFKLELYLPDDYPMCAPKNDIIEYSSIIRGPNPDDPLANDVAQDWKSDEKKAIEVAKEWTAKYAIDETEKTNDDKDESTTKESTQ
ncbi:Ubiquitin-conjugating enzyme family protein [Candida albicans]|uniref:Ubiquitin-conjugating enzyme family protein n=1 Tax=Candida albicans TaxID=5476 RepID=A0A8H6F2L7_CANAX|nr:Ubiquitin-conjugating enzyme family protein [Candida albicans]